MRTPSPLPFPRFFSGPFTLLLVLVLGLSLTACNDDDTLTEAEEQAVLESDPIESFGDDVDESENQPDEQSGEQQPAVANGGGFVAGSFADVPVPSSAEPVGGPQDVDGVQTQNYVVTSASPETIMSFYAEELPARGWVERDRQEVGEALRSMWDMDDVSLLVVATDRGDELEEVDLSLQLSTDRT